MSLKNHFEKTFKLNDTPWPIPLMILSAISITFPLVIGYLMQQMSLSMFGSLCSMVLVLNDHSGTLRKRIQHISTTYLVFVLTFILGSLLINKLLLLYVVLFVAAFILGKIKNQGPELEKLVLFGVLNTITIADTPNLSLPIIYHPLIYTFIAFTTYLIAMSLVHYFLINNTESVNSKKTTLKKAFKQNDSNSFSLFYAITAVFSFYLSKKLNFDRAYWITGTVLIVMLPDTHQSFYKAFQRVIGTAIGVIIAAFLLQYFNQSLSIIFFVFLIAFFSPLGLLMNYWLGNLFIAALVIYFLETASIGLDAWHISFLRTKDIAIGSFMAAFGIYLFNKFIGKFKSINIHQ